MLRSALSAFVTAGLALPVAACAPVVQGEALPALYEREAPLSRIAIAPFAPAGRLADEPAARPEKPSTQTSTGSPPVAPTLVGRYLGEALAPRVEVIPAEDVQRALGLEAAPREPLPPAEVARLASARFGADAVILGRVSRFVERSGEATGTRRPASVSFTVTLYEAPGARPLWTARFDETQRALSENVLDAGRYPGRGSRWLSAEELARWGAGELALALPLGR